MDRAELLEKVRNLPKLPGVYLYRDEKNKIIYVGKAKDLKSRVSSYFVENIITGSKTKALVEKIMDMDFIEVKSELEALLLEAELIKRYRPKYNISLKDDKSYKLIGVFNEKMDGDVLPVIRTIRAYKDKNLKMKGSLYGPYPVGVDVNYVLRSLRRIVPFRDCSPAKFHKYRKLGSPCLYGHIGLCSAPCVGRISPEDYRKSISYIKKFLSGDSKKLMNELTSKMNKASKAENFEEATYYRNIIKKYESVAYTFKSVSSYIENPNLMEDIRNEALTELKEKIPVLNKLPVRIECFDIANISGKSATASMTVSLNGKLANSEYKRFKVKTKDTPDDFWMIREVLRRRFKHEDWDKPDLVVIDGGKGQVSVAMEVLNELSIDMPLVGLAKRFELIVYKEGEEFKELELERTNEGLKLLQKLRDEAHRFARRYHHLLRMKDLH